MDEDNTEPDREICPPITDDEFRKTLLMLENDLDVYGWDQPPRIYAIRGTEGNYYLELLGRMAGDPAVDIGLAIECGVRLPPNAKGVVVTVEGWRHVRTRDLKQHYPGDYAAMVEAARLDGLIPDDTTEFDDALNKALDRLQHHIRPSMAPFRVEIRSVMAMMADGRGGMVMRDRGDDEAEIGEVGSHGRLVEALRALLEASK